MNKIRFCENCKRYTLNDTCTVCGSKTIIKAPPRYLNDEIVSKYRRETKFNERKSKNLI